MTIVFIRFTPGVEFDHSSHLNRHFKQFMVEGLVLDQRSVVRIQPSTNFCIEHLFTVSCIEKMKIKKKRPGIAHLKNNSFQSLRLRRESVKMRRI